MNKLGAAKYAFKGTSIIVEILILLIVAGPIAGVISPQIRSQENFGLGIDLNAIQPQLQQIFSSGSTINGTHEITVPAFNNWPISGEASLALAIVDGRQTIYQTERSTVELAPFQSGALVLTLNFTPSIAAKMQGKTLGIGGSMSISEGQFWTISVSLSQQ